MNTIKRLMWLLALAFTTCTRWLVSHIGYKGVMQAGLANPGTQQITADLAVALPIGMAFVVRDRRTQDRG